MIGRLIGIIVALSALTATLDVRAPDLAAAAERFAAPDGDGAAVDCLAADPCDIVDAINSVNAQPGDTVHVLPGTYVVSETLTVGSDLIVDGAGAHETIIVPGVLEGSLLEVTGVNAELRDLALDQSGAVSEWSPLVVRASAEIHGVRALGSIETPYEAIGCRILDGSVLVTDTVCAGGEVGLWAGGAGSMDVILRNVTALGLGWTDPDTASPGETFGIYARAGQQGLETAVDALNVIAAGDTAGVHAQTGGGNLAKAEVTLAHSNFASVSSAGPGVEAVSAAGSGENQTEPPIFVDASNLDFHQVYESPTVDGGDGTDPSIGFFDFDGEPRFGSGLEVDIGADEYVDGDADGVVDTSDNCPLDENPGQENQDADSAGDVCDAFPEDPTETTDTDGDGVGDNADPTPNGESPGGGGGADTAGGGAPGGSGGSPTVTRDTDAPRLKILLRTLKVSRRGVGRAKLHCPASEVSGPCRGALVLKTATKLSLAKGKRARVRLAGVDFRISAGRSTRVRLRLAGDELRLVKRSKLARTVKLVARVRDRVGNQKTVFKRARLRLR
ncbi:MAG: thrombospondin type 3 repeat-containing protein [Solirubrobacterales bacterium]